MPCLKNLLLKIIDQRHWLVLHLKCVCLNTHTHNVYYRKFQWINTLTWITARNEFFPSINYMHVYCVRFKSMLLYVWILIWWYLAYESHEMHSRLKWCFSPIIRVKWKKDELLPAYTWHGKEWKPHFKSIFS